MGGSGPTTVFMHPVHRLRREDLNQMAQLHRGEVILLDEQEIVGLLIKVVASCGAWNNDGDLHAWPLP